jgi:LPXTG-motif cell wall-anchored protein
VKRAALLLVVLGMLVGPGYYAFCAYLSGRPGKTYAMTERANRWTLPDGGILRVRGGMAYKPVPLELTPDENGYRMRFTFNVTQVDASKASNNYEATLMQGDISVMRRDIHVDGRGRVAVALDPLKILYPGSYTLLLEEVGAPALVVDGVGLQLDTGVEQPKMWLAWSGLALLAAGVILLLREAIMQKLKRR